MSFWLCARILWRDCTVSGSVVCVAQRQAANQPGRVFLATSRSVAWLWLRTGRHGRHRHRTGGLEAATAAVTIYGFGARTTVPSRRSPTTTGHDSDPHFSPDGTLCRVSLRSSPDRRRTIRTRMPSSACGFCQSHVRQRISSLSGAVKRRCVHVVGRRQVDFFCDPTQPYFQRCRKGGETVVEGYRSLACAAAWRRHTAGADLTAAPSH